MSESTQAPSESPGADGSGASMGPLLSILLYEDITAESVRAIVASLTAAPDASIQLRINSPGGGVTDGYALANALRMHKGRKVAVVDGLCGSAATFAACACDEIHMHEISLFMVHAPWAEAAGNSTALAEQGELLDKMADLMAALYRRKTGASDQKVREWMARDTWMTPDDAVAAGFCDRILSDEAPAQARAAAWRFLARLRQPTNKAKDKAMPDFLMNKLAKHGLGDDQSPEAIRKAYSAYMEETDDGAEARREMSRAMKAMDDDEQKCRAEADKDKDDDEKSKTDGGKQAKARDDGSAATASLVEKLVGKVGKLESDLAEERAKADRSAKEKAFAKKYANRVSEEDAVLYLASCGHDEKAAARLVEKHPIKADIYGRATVGGNPAGKDLPMASQGTPVVRFGRASVALHGLGFSKAVAKLLAEKGIDPRTDPNKAEEVEQAFAKTTEGRRLLAE